MEEGELEVFYRSSEIRTLVKTRSMQLATNEKRPLNLCRKKKKKKKDLDNGITNNHRPISISRA